MSKIGRLYKQGLNKLGFVNVSEAADPISALEVMHTQTVDVLITEQYMPFVGFCGPARNDLPPIFRSSWFLKK